jgi:hypothetical protein
MPQSYSRPTWWRWALSGGIRTRARDGVPLSPEGESIRDAVFMLIDSADEDGGELGGALRRAFAQARQSLGDDLEGRHLPEVEQRYAELDAYLNDGRGAPPLGYTTWLLVLSHLSPDEQRALQREYEELAHAADTVVAFGEPRSSEAGEGLMHALIAVEQLLAELPHTTLDRPKDDYDLRRRSLTIEVTDQPDSGDSVYSEPLRVHWRDGYQSLVATMTAGFYEHQLHWKLEIEDPPPGRETSRYLPTTSEDAHQAARDDLEEALAWAAQALGEHYTIAPLQDEQP